MTSGASLIAKLVKKKKKKNPPAMQELKKILSSPGHFHSWAGKIPWRRDRLPTPVFLGFPYGSAGKESACNVGDLGSIPGLGRSPGEGKGYPLQYSGLENSMDCIIHGIARSWTWPNNFHFTTCRAGLGAVQDYKDALDMEPGINRLPVKSGKWPVHTQFGGSIESKKGHKGHSENN